MTADARHHLLQAAAEASSAPAVKASIAGSSIVISVDWFWSGPGIVAMLGLCFTAGTFLVNLWSTYQREKRAREERMEAAAINAAKLARLNAGMQIPPEVESNRMELTP